MQFSLPLIGGNLIITNRINVTLLSSPPPILWNSWSEVAATNALVEDEAVEVVFKMNQKHILLAQNY